MRSERRYASLIRSPASYDRLNLNGRLKTVTLRRPPETCRGN
jgi:hypothetical protein